MDFRETIREIFEGLSGDNEQDIKYLNGKMEEYKDAENGKEIIRALGRKIFELLPEDKKEELNKIIGNEVDSIQATMEEALFQLKQNNPEKAESLFKSAIDSIPLEFNEDKECRYFCFDSLLELTIFAVSEKFEKKIRKPTYEFAQLYYYYGYSLIENKKFDEAEEALKTALKWNPVSTTIIGELAEIYKIKKDYDNYLICSKNILKYATSSEMLARGYRNIAYFYVDVERYEDAAAIYYFSRYFEESKQVTSELYFIAETIGKLPEQPSIERIKELFEKEDIPFGASDFVVGAAYQLAQTYLENNNIPGAKYHLAVVYDLTHDDKVLEMIKSLEENDEK